MLRSVHLLGYLRTMPFFKNLTPPFNILSPPRPEPHQASHRSRFPCRVTGGTGDLARVQCHLETRELWQKFNELGTEMIITKSGR